MGVRWLLASSRPLLATLPLVTASLTAPRLGRSAAARLSLARERYRPAGRAPVSAFPMRTSAVTVAATADLVPPPLGFGSRRLWGGAALRTMFAAREGFRWTASPNTH